MNFSMEHIFDWPAEKIIEILASGKDIVPMDELPNVSHRKIIEVKREGKKLFKRLDWCVHGQIPKIAQRIISPDKLTFTEESVWDDDTTTFTTKITPHYMASKFKCTTTSQWSAAGPVKARRSFKGRLEIYLPVIGPLLEMTIIDYLKKNNEKNAELVRKALSEKFGPPSK